MTQQYLGGELSVLLGQLQLAMTNDAWTVEVARLRHLAETRPCWQLAVVAVHALEAADDMCWDSLTHGDAAAFTRQAAVDADLWEFSLCAGLFEEW